MEEFLCCYAQYISNLKVDKILYRAIILYALCKIVTDIVVLIVNPIDPLYAYSNIIGDGEFSIIIIISGLTAVNK